MWLMATCQWPWYSTPRLRHRLSGQRQFHLGRIKIQEPWGRVRKRQSNRGDRPVNQVIWTSIYHFQAFAVTQPEAELVLPEPSCRTSSAIYSRVIKERRAHYFTQPVMLETVFPTIISNHFYYVSLSCNLNLNLHTYEKQRRRECNAQHEREQNKDFYNTKELPACSPR